LPAGEGNGSSGVGQTAALRVLLGRHRPWSGVDAAKCRRL